MEKSDELTGQAEEIPAPEKNAAERQQAKGAEKAPLSQLPKAHPQEKKEDSTQELSQLSEQMLRLQAEFDNFKKRTIKEKDALSQQAEAGVLLRMLPVYEEIKLAEAEAAKIRDESVKKGVLLVLGKLRQSFEKEGLQEMNLEGQKYDPFRHETAMREDSEAPEGTIVRVIQKGYLFRGSVLRHAIVSVSSGTPAKKEEKKE